MVGYVSIYVEGYMWKINDFCNEYHKKSKVLTKQLNFN